MSQQTRRLSRRNFLLAAGAGTAATAAAIVAKTSPSAPAAPDTSKRATKAYAETQHMRDYYRTAKV
ncbi:MAG: twin-arginine translocation signal domain-containing protein [Betaproteobacteria bacterium]|nr:twin-arginine translocation signal domain-containing protein [Betaproteobacteria bacterium]